MIKRTKYLFIIFLPVLICFLSYASQTKADSSDNVFGWAWTSNIGWISFNNMGLTFEGNPAVVSDSFTDTGATSGGIPPGVPDISSNTHGYGIITPGINYGVHICATEEDAKCQEIPAGSRIGRIIGYAWSENLGWIKFNPVLDSYTTSYPNSSTTDYAKVDLGASGDYYTITGWARACSVYSSVCINNTTGSAGQICNTSPCPSGQTCKTQCSGALNPNRGGWDGWIKLDNTLKNLTIDKDVDPIHGWHPFHQWVWGGNTDGDANKSVIGWGTFNCEQGSATGGPFCTINGGHDYKVVTTLCAACDNELDCGDGQACCGNICCDGVCSPNDEECIKNQPPVAEGLGITKNYCANNISFYWKYSDPEGDPETKVEFQVATDRSFSESSIVVNRTYCGTFNVNDSRTVNLDFYPTSSVHPYCEGEYSAETPDVLSYKKSYYWRVRVYDNKENSPEWVEYNDPLDVDGDKTKEGDSNPLTFTTWSHHYPSVGFKSNWTGNVSTWVNKSAPISLTDKTICYDDEGHYNGDGTSINYCAAYFWDFDYNNNDRCVDAINLDLQDGPCEIEIDPYTSNRIYKYTYQSTDNPVIAADVSVLEEVFDNDGLHCSTIQEMKIKNPLKVPQWQEISPF